MRVLLLGVLWDLALVWPGWELRDPLESVREALAEAPAHDLLILGHNHRFLEEPARELRGPPPSSRSLPSRCGPRT